jgi:hypothetical protein
VAGLEAARLGQIRLGDVVGLPLFNIGRRWRACCRGSWAIDDELGELRGIAGAFAVVSHIQSNAMIIAMAATTRDTSVV